MTGQADPWQRFETAVQERYPKAVLCSEGRWHMAINLDGRQLTVTWQRAGYGVFTIIDDDANTVDMVIMSEVAFAIVSQKLGEP